MKYFEKNGLKYYTFESFPETITNAVFTRKGGVSEGSLWGLNVGSNVGDNIVNVRENKSKIFEAICINESTFFDCWQVHGPDYVIVNASHSKRGLFREIKADAMITDDPNVTLFMRFADCTPIMIYDPVKKVVGIAHAGWQGTVKKVASNLVRGFKESYGSDPKDLIAGIGPSIGPDHYEIGEKVKTDVKIAYSHNTNRLLQHNSPYDTTFDLWEANRIDLDNSGVSNIEVSEICTACNTNEWFSHRAEGGKTGRFAAIISLAKGI